MLINKLNRKLNKAGITLIVLFVCLIPFAMAHADSLQEFVLTQLDGKGTVNSVDLTKSKIVIDDLSYVIARGTTVFNVNNRKRISLDGLKPGDYVGFKSKALKEPTAPYDQKLIKIWILPSKS